MASFDYYTDSTAIAAASPRAGAYNLEASLVLDGSFLNYGGVRCRFGGLGATTAVFDGSWSNYPFFESGTVVVSSGKEGVFFLKYRKPELVP